VSGVKRYVSANVLVCIFNIQHDLFLKAKGLRDADWTYET
jgi:hypothetical protein